MSITWQRLQPPSVTIFYIDHRFNGQHVVQIGSKPRSQYNNMFQLALSSYHLPPPPKNTRMCLSCSQQKVGQQKFMQQTHDHRMRNHLVQRPGLAHHRVNTFGLVTLEVIPAWEVAATIGWPPNTHRSPRYRHPKSSNPKVPKNIERHHLYVHCTCMKSMFKLFSKKHSPTKHKVWAPDSVSSGWIASLISSASARVNKSFKITCCDAKENQNQPGKPMKI